MLRVYAVTAGDSSGVGPEILLKAFQRGEIKYPFVVYGDWEVLGLYNGLLNCDVPLRKVSNAGEYQAGFVNVVDSGIMVRDEVTVGKLNKKSGLAAREYVVAATRATMAGEVAGIVTLPMNKKATQLSDPGFTGHTELIGALCRAKDVTIMLACDELIVTHISTHVSLATALTRVKRERIATIIRLTHETVGKLKSSPRIAVAGLNPHAGENGLFGDEEIQEIIPAVEWARNQGWQVEGPLPPDTVFYFAVHRKQFDAVVCMYHDQGHIPSKLIDFEGGVNITLGLPIVRTSVDHGTAFDIAGQGRASTTSFIRAMDYAAQLA